MSRDRIGRRKRSFCAAVAILAEQIHVALVRRRDVDRHGSERREARPRAARARSHAASDARRRPRMCGVSTPASRALPRISRTSASLGPCAVSAHRVRNGMTTVAHEAFDAPAIASARPGSAAGRGSVTRAPPPEGSRSTT